MRRIKFRAWDNEWERWIAPKDIEVSGDGIVDCVRRGESGDKIEIASLSAITLMQYTDCDDRNGKEIYEGDIVFNDWKSVNGKQLGKIWIVKFGSYDDSDLDWGSPGVGFYCDAMDGGEQQSIIHFSRIEVIGNIYENPGLIP